MLKSATVLSLALSAGSVVTPVLFNGTQAFAAISTDKVGTLTSATATATINKVGENANKAIEMDYSVNLTIPNDVKTGDTVRVTTINLGDFIPAGETKAPVTIDGVEVGTITRVENQNKRYDQNSPETTLAQKKSANIEAGTQDNSYQITFNAKASEYKSKTLTLKATSNLVYATTVKKDTPIRAQIFMNKQLLATKDYTLTATKPAPEVKSQKSALDYSRNTRMQVVETGGKRIAQNFLGSIMMPLDRDYPKGSTIEVELPKDSMVKFTAASTYTGKDALTHFPVLRENTDANGNNVYLYDQQKVFLKAKSITDTKVVYEVVDGTLKRGDSYVGLPNQTGVNFALTNKASGKLSKDGSKIGPETVTSTFKTPDGKPGETQGNSLAITINGAKVTADGLKEIANHKVTTKYVDEATKKEIDKSVTGDVALPKKDIKGYTYTTSETDAEGNVTHYYRAVTKDVKTEYITTTGEELDKPVVAKEAQPKKDFKGYTFVETKTDKDGNVQHIYKKDAEKPTTKVVTNFVDKATGKPIDKQVDGKADKHDIQGYKFVETKTDKDGNVTHYYEKIGVKAITKFLEKGTNKEIAKQVDGSVDKQDIDGYKFVETKYIYSKPADKKVKDSKPDSKEVAEKDDKLLDNGYALTETHHIYEKVIKTQATGVTKFLEDKTDKELAKQVNGDTDKQTIAGYDYVRSEYVYRKSSATASNEGKVVSSKDSKLESDGYKLVETRHFYKKSAVATPDVKPDTKNPVQTAASVAHNTAPLIATLLSGLAGVGAYFGFKRRKN